MNAPTSTSHARPRRRGSRGRARSVAAIALGLSAALLSASPGQAEPLSTTWKDSPLACNSYGQCVQARVLKGQGNVWGAGYYRGLRPGTSTTMTIVVYQCSGTGTNCGAMSANRLPVTTNTWGGTSSKGVSFGHTYRTCVSGAGLVNVCSPLLA